MFLCLWGTLGLVTAAGHCQSTAGLPPAASQVALVPYLSWAG